MTDPNEQVHQAINQAFLDDGEIAINWVVIIDIAGTDDSRYLSHRSGGGHDGNDAPTAWAALGMLRSGVLLAEAQLVDMTTYDEEPDDEDQDDDPEDD